MKPTGPTNPETRKLIIELRKLSNKQKVKIWKDIAKRLEKPKRQRPVVNVRKLERYCKKNESVIIPGKLLADGSISKSIKVACLNCSAASCEKIKKAGGQCMSINEIMKANPKGKKIRIMG